MMKEREEVKKSLEARVEEELKINQEVAENYRWVHNMCCDVTVGGTKCRVGYRCVHEMSWVVQQDCEHVFMCLAVQGIAERAFGFEEPLDVALRYQGEDGSKCKGPQAAARTPGEAEQCTGGVLPQSKSVQQGRP